MLPQWNCHLMYCQLINLKELLRPISWKCITFFPPVFDNRLQGFKWFMVYICFTYILCFYIFVMHGLIALLSLQTRTFINFMFSSAHLLTQHFSRGLHSQSQHTLKLNEQICGGITVMIYCYIASVIWSYCICFCYRKHVLVNLLVLVFCTLWAITLMKYNTTNTHVCVSCAAFAWYKPSLYFTQLYWQCTHDVLSRFCIRSTFQKQSVCSSAVTLIFHSSWTKILEKGVWTQMQMQQQSRFSIKIFIK